MVSTPANAQNLNSTNNGVVLWDGSKNISSTALTNGELIIGSTGVAPVAGHLTSTAGTLVVTEGAGTLNIDTPIVLQTDTGFVAWNAAGPYFDDTTLGSFTLLVAGFGFINGVRVNWTAPQTQTGMAAGNTYFLYIDSVGTLRKTTIRTDQLYQNNIVLFECWRDNATPTTHQTTVKENHDYGFPVETSNYLHDVINTVIENHDNGANITLNGTQKIQINGADSLNDHGLITDIPDSGGVAVTWNFVYTDATGKWVRYAQSDTFTAIYNNAGTVTALTANRFTIFTLYASKDNITTTTPTYFAIINSAQYTTQGAATTAIANGTNSQQSAELAAIELVQLGQIVFRQSTTAIVVVNIAKTTFRSSTSTSGTNQASLVNTDTTNFNGVLSATDTNVQTALDTIDEYRGGLYTVEATANQSLISNRRFVVKNATPANLTTLTLPATAIQGDTIAVNGYTSGGWKIAQNANQQIFFDGSSTTIGVGGSLASTLAKDAVRIVCVTAGASTEWEVEMSIGNLTIV